MTNDEDGVFKKNHFLKKRQKSKDALFRSRKAAKNDHIKLIFDLQTTIAYRGLPPGFEVHCNGWCWVGGWLETELQTSRRQKTASYRNQ